MTYLSVSWASFQVLSDTQSKHLDLPMLKCVQEDKAIETQIISHIHVIYAFPEQKDELLFRTPQNLF